MRPGNTEKGRGAKKIRESFAARIIIYRKVDGRIINLPTVLFKFSKMLTIYDRPKWSNRRIAEFF